MYNFAAGTTLSCKLDVHVLTVPSIDYQCILSLAIGYDIRSHEHIVNTSSCISRRVLSHDLVQNIKT